MSEPTDAALLDAWRAGDREAGSALFERHFVSVFRFFAAKLGDVAAADLSQRTFEAVVQHRDRVREGSKFRAYLFTVARNQLLMHLRSRGRHGVDAELMSSAIEDMLPSPDSALAGSEQERLVIRALRSLTLDQQMLLELHYWEQLSTEDIGEILGVARGTVKSRLYRAREDLRDALASASQGGALAPGSIEEIEQWVARIRAGRPA
ncbi:MAG: sigma-70 family RNA polymerase sigma factor [Nannocystaceae bacterium]|nr:sigma-70 family RNA polymerase sigma factor [Nannocystaceae bacterium]